MVEYVIWTTVRKDLVDIMARFDMIEPFCKEIELVLEPWNKYIMKNEPWILDA